MTYFQSSRHESPIIWSCKIHRLLLCRGVRLHQRIAQSAEAVKYTNCIAVDGKDSPNECPEYDSKPFDGLEIWKM